MPVGKCKARVCLGLMDFFAGVVNPILSNQLTLGIVTSCCIFRA